MVRETKFEKLSRTRSKAYESEAACDSAVDYDLRCGVHQQRIPRIIT